MCERFKKVLQLRDKWIQIPDDGIIGMKLREDQINMDLNSYEFPKSITDEYILKFKDGIMNLTEKSTKKDIFNMSGYKFDDYIVDIGEVLDLTAFGPAKTMSYRRLQILKNRFTLHFWLNKNVEVTEVRNVPYRDFYVRNSYAYICLLCGNQ